MGVLCQNQRQKKSWKWNIPVCISWNFCEIHTGIVNQFHEFFKAYRHSTSCIGQIHMLAPLIHISKKLAYQGNIWKNIKFRVFKMD